METLLIAVGVFGVIGTTVFFALAPKTTAQEDIIQRRLESLTPRQEETPRPIRLLTGEEDTFWDRVSRFFLGENELAAKYTAVRRVLHQAGYPGERAVRLFWGVRFFLATVLAVVALFASLVAGASTSKMVFVILAGALAGSILPFLFVRGKAKRRRQNIQETLPDTLDLLVVCVEAGLGVDSALVRVANEQESQGQDIGKEFQLLTQEIQAGMPRRGAMSRMADRLGLDDLRSMVTFLTQTEEMGGSIARSLRVFAATMRQKRMQKAEEAARKAIIKLMIPVVLLILPALFLIVLGPPVVNMIKVLGSIQW